MDNDINIKDKKIIVVILGIILCISIFSENKLFNKKERIKNNNNVLQKDIASIMGLSVFTYSHYETEDTTIPLKHLIDFCDYFKIRIDYILGLDSKYELESGYNIVDILICAKILK